MNIFEASKMEEGTKFNLAEYDNCGYLYFGEGKVYSDKGVPQHADVDLFTSTWEVVKDEKDWNLAYASFNGECFSPGVEELKKCRDLIIKDIQDKFGWQNDAFSIKTINKRFGDLK